MQRCERCGESNPGDAAFCATCGLQLGEVGGLAALGQSPDAADQPTGRSTEWVDAPAFGETAQPVAPDEPAAVAPTEALPTAPRPVPPVAAPPVADSRSTSVMIAALAVAIVVIVGGVAVLLTATGGEDDTVGTAGPETTTATTDAVSTDPIATTVTTAAEQSESSEVATVPDATTVPETTTATTVAPARGPGDLGLAQPILDEACDGRYITFVGSAVGAMPYEEEVSMLLAQYPNSNYIWTKACPSLRQEFRDGNDIYGVVFGPYLTQGEACDAVAFGPPDAYVRRISTTDPEDHTVDC